jgi:hypothetical protein
MALTDGGAPSVHKHNRFTGTTDSDGVDWFSVRDPECHDGGVQASRDEVETRP